MVHDVGPSDDGRRTAGGDYTQRLLDLEGQTWKRWLNVQAPYRWNLKRLQLGRTLDVGCGIGRNLNNLDGNGVGVDHNPESVMAARRRGLTAYTTEEFPSSPDGVPAGFDTLLMSHVLEHVDPRVAEDILRAYLPFVRPGGHVLLITPQEVGYRSDSTHVRFVDGESLAAYARSGGLTVEKSYSFPLPRPAGKLFRYNEFVLLARVPA
ncbi:MAG TPA: class I SAM-dependent methyltransferase [Oryzihumus sp.]|nr:class I SAM-dependent methyltransferase [Oryzihumus sp.]